MQVEECISSLCCEQGADVCKACALRAGKRMHVPEELCGWEKGCMHVLEELCGGKKDACAGKILRGSKADYDISGGTRDG